MSFHNLLPSRSIRNLVAAHHLDLPATHAISTLSKSLISYFLCITLLFPLDSLLGPHLVFIPTLTWNCLFFSYAQQQPKLFITQALLHHISPDFHWVYLSMLRLFSSKHTELDYKALSSRTNLSLLNNTGVSYWNYFYCSLRKILAVWHTC